MKKFLLGVIFIVFSQSLFAQMKYLEDKDYTILSNPLPLQKSGEKEVLEFFSYSCSHCARLNPHLTRWINEKKPKDVGFYHIPALGGGWNFVGRVKLTADKLGLGEDFDQAYFDAMHKDRQRKLLGDKEAAFEIIQNFAKVDITEIEKAWNSLAVKNNMQKAAKLWNQSGASGVPALIVNGKYKVGNKSPEELLNVIEFLLATTKP